SVLIAVAVAALEVGPCAHVLLVAQIGASIVFALIVWARIAGKVGAALPQTVTVAMLVAMLACVHRAAVDHHPVLGPGCASRHKEKRQKQKSRAFHPFAHKLLLAGTLYEIRRVLPRDGRTRQKPGRWGISLRTGRARYHQANRLGLAGSGIAN